MKSRTLQQLRVEPDFAPSSAARRANAASFEPAAASSASAAATSDGAADTRWIDWRKAYLIRPLERLVPAAFGVGVATALLIGWIYRDEGHLTPETGTGYMLGIVGASMMLLLLLYPLRKRVRMLRLLGSVPGWFRSHMVLGILGPALILFHSNFKLGSLNSNVALSAMLAVVASGIVGRYLYAKVHNGLYGRKSEVADILGDAQAIKAALGDDVEGAGRILDGLRAFEADVLAARRGALSSLNSFMLLGARMRRCRRFANGQLSIALKAQARRHGWTWREARRRGKEARTELRLYFSAVRKAARFSVYERLFAQWHIWHLPLFLLLVVTAIIHVVAVHLY